MKLNMLLTTTVAAACCAHLALAQPPSVANKSTDAIAHEGSFNTIQGAISFSDNGSTLAVSGHATGMTPGLTYVSFIYGTGSFPRGTLACLPPTPNNLTATQMFLGTWLPVNSAVRTLQASKTGSSYASLSQFATSSIRYDSNPAAGNQPPTPARYWLQTCGRAIPVDPGDFLAAAAEGDTGN